MRTILEIPSGVVVNSEEFLRILNERLRQISEGLGAGGSGGIARAPARRVSSGGGGGVIVVSGGSYLVPIIVNVATPDPSLGAIQKIIVVDVLAIAAPIGTPADGARVALFIIQDLTLGGFQPAFDAIYKLGDYAVLNIDKGCYAILDLIWDTANWYIYGVPVMGQFI
jgi:hypothetical protein